MQRQQQHQQLQQISKLSDDQNIDQSKIVSLTKSSSSSAQILISVPESTSNGQPKQQRQVIAKPFHKCQWTMCDRVFVGLEDLRTHVLDVHVAGFDENEGEDSGEVAVQTLIEDEQSIKQVNRMNPIESTLDEIVSDGQSCATSHDHAYDHQIDHLPSAPLNESASPICSFAECVDLTFNHRPSLLRHTRLKHSQSLHPIHCKPFTNVRRPAQSNHVLKIVVTDKMACSLCDKWFQWRDDLEIHVIEEHTVLELVTDGFDGRKGTLECDKELERNPGLLQAPEHQVIELLIDSDFNEKSLNKMDCDEEELQQTEQQVIELNESTNDRSFKSAQHSVFDNTSRCDANFNLESLEGIDSLSDSDYHLLEEINSNESDSEEENVHPQQLEAQQKTNESNNDNNDQDFLDYLAEIQIVDHGVSNNCDYQNCEDEVKVINDSQQLQYAIVDDNKLDRSNINKHQQQNQDQFIRELDQSSLNSTQPLNQPNPILAQSNVHLNEPNPPTHLSTQQKVLLPNKSTGKHVCEVCCKKFTAPSNLVIHIRTHTGEKPFSCTSKDCGKTFARSEDLKRHIRTHTGEKPFSCTWKDCGKKFVQREHLKRHIRTHTREKPFACNWKDCGKTFAQSANLKNHIRMHAREKPFSCNWKNCLKKFTKSDHLKDHIRTHTGEKPFSCTWKDCGKEFVQRVHLKRHIRTHTREKPFACNWKDCGKAFAQREHLKRHIRMHNREKPFTELTRGKQNCQVAIPEKPKGKFVCEMCEKEFKRRSNLVSHIRTHTGEKPFACTWKNCEKEFVDRVNLKIHIRTHTGEKPFICTWKDCHKSFARKDKMKVHHIAHSMEFPENLTGHTRSHTKERLLLDCPKKDCGKTYVSKTGLNRHIKSHTGKSKTNNKHLCKYCDKTFMESTHLTVHIRSHTGEKPFKCSWKDCDRAFSTKCSLKTHFIRHSMRSIKQQQQQISIKLNSNCAQPNFPEKVQPDSITVQSHNSLGYTSIQSYIESFSLTELNNFPVEPNCSFNTTTAPCVNQQEEQFAELHNLKPNMIPEESSYTVIENLSPLIPVNDPSSILMHNLDPMIMDQPNLETIMGLSIDLLFDESEFEKHIKSLLDSPTMVH